MGVEGPGNGGLLGGECHAFFEGFCGGDGGAVGGEGLLWAITDEKEEQVEEKHGWLWKKKKKRVGLREQRFVKIYVGVCVCGLVVMLLLNVG